MQEITQKLHKKVMDDFLPIAENLAQAGHDKDYIVAAFQKQLHLKVNQYYSNLHKGMEPLSEIIGSDFKRLIDSQSVGSKAEKVFYNLLCDRGIKFNFQYKIGPYTADYLFAGFLVVELDGPQHNKDHDDKRDKYMRGLGYKIIRVPMIVLVSCPEAVIDEILDAIKGIRIVPGNKKKQSATGGI